MKDNEIVQAKRHNYVVPAVAGSMGAVMALAPALAFAEGESATVETAVTGMATSVATSGQSMLIAILPVLAPLVGAIIVAGLGYKLVKRFSK